MYHEASRTTSVLRPDDDKRAPDQLDRLPPSGTVPTTAYRPGGPGRGWAPGQAPALSVGARVCRARSSRQAGDREHREAPPGVEGDLWDPPEKTAHAVERIERWQRYRPVPLHRIDIPKKNGTRRPVSMPAMVDRARQALDLQAWQPMAETLAAPHAYGFRPTRRCADALDPCGKVLRQKTSATWLVEADIHGFFDHLDFSWGEAHSPRNQDVLSQWLRSGFIDHGVLSPPTAGVPKGGSARLGEVTWCWTGAKPSGTVARGLAGCTTSMTSDGRTISLSRPMRGRYEKPRSYHESTPF